MFCLALKYTYFCPRCGKPTQYNKERNGLCIDCFVELEKAELENEDFKFDVTICIGCGRIKHGNLWLELNKEVLKTRLYSLIHDTKLKFYDFEVELPTNIDLSSAYQYDKLDIIANVSVRDQKIIRKQITLRINKAFCPLCSKKQSGKYYESVIHIRFQRESRSKLTEVLSEFINTTTTRLEKLETIDVKKEGEGIVIRLSSRKLAKELLSALNRKFSLAILRKYRTPVTVNINNRQQLINIDVFIIRLFQA